MNINDIPDRMFLDLAIGVNTFEEVCSIYGIEVEDAELLSSHPLFQQRIAVAKQAVEDDGRAFKARCRTVANDMIPHVVRLMKDPDTAASVQLDAFKTIAKLGDLEPVKADAKSAASGPVLNLTIVGPEGQTVSPVPILPHAEIIDDEHAVITSPVRGFFVSTSSIEN